MKPKAFRKDVSEPQRALIARLVKGEVGGRVWGGHGEGWGAAGRHCVQGIFPRNGLPDPEATICDRPSIFSQQFFNGSVSRVSMLGPQPDLLRRAWLRPCPEQSSVFWGHRDTADLFLSLALPLQCIVRLPAVLVSVIPLHSYYHWQTVIDDEFMMGSNVLDAT